ncbi:MAG: hypothetical protein JNK54_10165 [Elusimicrobia bacterium]|nr:hypothetical protein [Elusimicrobiota bacterium]
MRGIRVAGVLAFMWPMVAAGAPLLLDQFNGGKAENALGGATGAWYDPDDKSIFCRVEFDDQVFVGASGKSLRLDYNIESKRENVFIPTQYSQTNPAVIGNLAFNGYYSIFPPQDLSQHTHLILWAKGDPINGFSRSFKIEIKDGLNTTYAGYKVTGLTDEWRRYAIPLREFRDIQDWTSIKEFVIVFAADAMTRKNGTLFIDDIYFADNPEQNFSVPMGSFTSTHADPPPLLDGRVKEWGRSGWHNISKGENVESGARKGIRDAGARWTTRWDDQWFYVAVQLRDNEVVNGEIGETLWKDDCVEIFVSPDGRDFDWGDPAVFQLGFSPTSSAGNPAQWAWFQRRAPTDAEVKTAWNKKLNILEVAIAWSFLDVSPGVNRELGFALAFHDRDVKDGTPQCKLASSIGNLGKTRTRVGRMVLK